MKETRFTVPSLAYYFAQAVCATSSVWVRAGNLETALLGQRLQTIEIDRPIYVGSMARSGTTILTEMIGQHPDVAHHYYRDCINIWTLRSWDLIASCIPDDDTLVERIHEDGLKVNNRSPDAVEEIIWMKFFDFLHDERCSNILNRETKNDDFERFYREHLQKLLFTRDGRRYLTKSNHIVTRMSYLLRLFPDTRFIVPVRHPINHIASCVKQDKLLQRRLTADLKMKWMVYLMGHFEFGPNKRCINLGDQRVVDRIRHLWEQDKLIEGWSHYWSTIYAYILRQINSSPALKKACLIIRYESVCRDSADAIDRILEHCALPATAFDPIRQHYIDKFHEPTYYKPAFDEREIGLIKELTGEVAAELGYKDYPI